MSFPRGKKLVQYFLDGIIRYPEFKVLKESNPLILQFNGKKYMLFFKCISYAGNPYPENTTRAQLPYNESFNALTDDVVFLFLGYDVSNDLYVCWDPIKTRSRLNQKTYVSFFCRKSLQDNLEEGEIKTGRLSNGDAYVLFKRTDICSFFEMIELSFPGLLMKNDKVQDVGANRPVTESIEGYLDDLRTDQSVQLLVDQLISEGKSKLTIVSECMNTFGSYYYNMRFADWANVVKYYLDSF